MAQMNFEESITRLEEIVAKLESGNCTLDESFALFEEGTKLSKECYETLNNAKIKISELTGKE